jgi:hypothetical protein
VFTHLLPDDAANYAAQSGRVLRPGGRLFSTWFLVDVELADGARFDFAIPGAGYRTIDAETPEAAVGYRFEDVEAMLGAAGLDVVDVRRGYWSGNEGLALQDFVVATKRG